MGKKEKLQKLDLILEKLKFWRYIIFGIVSGMLGIAISASQNKLQINLIIMLIVLFGFVGIVISIKRIDNLTKTYYILLDYLEKEE